MPTVLKRMKNFQKMLTCKNFDFSSNVFRRRFPGGRSPNDKMLDLSKLETFAHDKINVTHKIINLFRKGYKHSGKGGNVSKSFHFQGR